MTCAGSLVGFFGNTQHAKQRAALRCSSAVHGQRGLTLYMKPGSWFALHYLLAFALRETLGVHS